jgi:hypothetical protein
MYTVFQGLVMRDTPEEQGNAHSTTEREQIFLIMGIVEVKFAPLRSTMGCGGAKLDT